MRTQLGDKSRLALSALALCAAFVLIVLASLAFIPHQYLERVEGKWVRFGIVSVAFLGYAAKAYWKLRKSPNFWAIFAGFVVIHVCGIGYFFYAGTGLPLLIFGPLCGVEFGCMALIIHWFLGVGPDKVNLNV